MDIMIIDNFLSFPNQIREWALQQEYLTDEETNLRTGANNTWPGIRTKPVDMLDPDYAKVVYNQVGNIIRKNDYNNYKGMLFLSCFHLTGINSSSSWVHMDDDDTKYAGIIYLSPDADPSCGTTFYKCNNFEKWSKYASDPRYERTINETENYEIYRELFSPVDFVGNVYNRLVLYKSNLFHNASNYFGTDKKSSRLTQILFIKTVVNEETTDNG